MSENEPRPLDYSTPATESRRPRSERQRLAGFFTVLAILFGLPFLSAGLGGLFSGLSLANRGARDEAFFLSAVFLGIAGICAFAAIRWGREWYGRRGRG